MPLPQVPYFIPDTPAARADLAAQYTTIGRMDQGGSGSPGVGVSVRARSLGPGGCGGTPVSGPCPTVPVSPTGKT